MTDHKAEAEEYVDFMFRMGATEDVRSTAVGKAQAHATLYLAEQQRVANLIALAAMNGPRADFTKPWDGTEDTDLWRDIRAQVVEALGIGA